MQRIQPVSARGLSRRDASHARGSAVVMSVFVLALLTSMALVVILVSQTEVKMSDAEAQAKKAFYLAEAATEHGREQLRLNMVAGNTSSLVPRLADAANDGTIDFDPSDVRPQFSGGTLTGFSGTGDDLPLVGPTQIGDGWYAVYLTNDPAEGETTMTESNQFVMLNGLGVGPDGAFEMAQAIVRPGSIFPPIPATITLLGPDPEYTLGSGKGWADIECPKGSGGSKVVIDGVPVKGSKIYRAFQGTDCAPYRELGPDVTVGSKVYPSLVDTGGGGIPGVFMPTIGVVGGTAETDVEDELKGSKIDYLSDNDTRTAIVRPDEPTTGYQDEDTVADLTDATEVTVIGSGLGTLDPTWQDCAAVKDIVETIRTMADYVCTPPGCSLPATTAGSVSFIDGDFRIDCDAEGYGMLVVTGALDVPASASWHGIIFVIGEGEFYRVKKEGYGNITGGTVVADIAGPDNVYGTADDCTGGTGGFASVYFEEQKKKAYGTTGYCSDEIAAADPGFKDPAVVVSFRQD